VARPKGSSNHTHTPTLATPAPSNRPPDSHRGGAGDCARVNGGAGVRQQYMSPLSTIQDVARKALSSIEWFSRLVVKRPLRKYQLAPALAIVDSVIHHKGLEFAVMFPRQSGKNETQGQLEAYLLTLFQQIPGAQIVKAQPTMRPQGLNALARLERSLRNDWNTPRNAQGAGRPHWHTAHGHQIKLGEAMIAFFSANPDANTVGATATLLLECDEAQDVLEAEWEKKFMPMAASTNATVVYWGTAWTRRTLLAKAVRAMRELEAKDGVQRVFIVTPDQVAAENPQYGKFIARQVAKHGRQHPLVKTQYFNEEIDAEGGMFPPARRALLQGTHKRQQQPATDKVYCLLLDVAGEDEGAVGDPNSTRAGRTDTLSLENPKRDATVLTIVEVDLSTLSDPVLVAPTYRVVERAIWVGEPHAKLYAIIRAIAIGWRARYLVADATGVGAGLVSFLGNALGLADPAAGAGGVIPFDFTSSSKSKLGWDFLGIVDSGRFQTYAAAAGDADAATFNTELEFCQYEVMPGPGRLLRWGVPDGTRDPATAELVHDDALLSAALVAVLDAQPWAADTGPGTILHTPDPLDDMSEGF
jgi:hypothetical protein